MKAAVLLGAALSLLADNASALPLDAVRSCERRTCLSAAGNEKLELTCGGSGETIKSITFASFGKPLGVGCPSANDELFNKTDVDLRVNPDCGASSSKAIIEEACLKKEECTVDLSQVFKLSDAGLESCNATALADLEMDVQIECGEVFDAFAIVTALLIGIIGLALGASVEIHQFLEVFREHKRAVLVGWICQFGFMPLIAFFFVKVMQFDDRVAIGVILTGSSPGGTTSNLLTYWAKGSVALSMTMSAASTLCAFFMLPLLSFAYINGALGLTDSVTLPIGNIVATLMVAIVPACFGLWIRHKSERIAKKVEKIGSIIGALFMVGAFVLGVTDNPDILKVNEYPRAWLAAAFFQPAGCLAGYVMARLCRLPHPEARAVCLETGVQSFTLTIALVTLSYTGCERLVVLTFPLISTMWYLINSLWITLFLRYVLAPRDSAKEIEDLRVESEELATHRVKPDL